LFPSARTGTFEFKLHNFLLAIAAPSRSTRSLAQAICGWTRPPRPQSVPGDDVFLPTISANVMMRSAISSGGSTRSVAWLTIPAGLLDNNWIAICHPRYLFFHQSPQL
jgi:hypothetical protein